ncbi:MAG: Ig-like domain-containing protein [Pseudomonadota bacterium]
MLLRALEPRILLDAAGGADALDLTNSAVHGDLAAAFFQPDNSAGDRNSNSWSQIADALTTTPPYLPQDERSDTGSGKQIAFVAADIPNAAELIGSLDPDIEVVLLNSASPGLSQISDALLLQSNVDAVHIFSHGSSGSLALGGPELTVETMASLYANDLASIGGALSQHGDILIYGCDFAAGDAGQQAAQLLAQMTGADVAASDDLTGNANLGGDWDLEKTIGTVEARVLTAGQQWIGTLSTVNSTVLFAQDSPISDADDNDRLRLTDTAIQTFTYNSGTATYEIDQVDLVLRYDSGDMDANVRVSIKETVLGPEIAVGNLPFTDLSTNYEWHSIVFNSPAVLNSGQEYIILASSDRPFATAEAAVEEDGSFTNGESQEFGDDADMLFRAVVNNGTPEFTLLAGTNAPRIGVDENTTEVATITASDPDGDTLTYSIIAEETPGTFTIDANTGVLSFINPPDFENPTDAVGQDNRYSVTVQISDGNGGIATKEYVARVDDVNEDPIISGPATGTISFDVNENQTTFTTVNALDPEGEDVTYAIVGGDSASSFTIDTDTGVLTFVAPPDFENPTDIGGNNGYGVRVRATSDSGGFDERLFFARVQDVDEAPAIAGQPTGTVVVNVDENQALATTVDAVDPEGGAVTYHIVGGSSSSAFTVDENSGALTFNQIPDFENPHDSNTNNTYGVYIEARDAAGNASLVIYNIVVQDVNEAPVFDAPGTGHVNVSVDENQTAITTIGATDPEADGITYSIAGGNSGYAFTIDPNTGGLSFLAPADFENPTDSNTNNVYTVIIRATDDNGAFSDREYRVKVVDLNEAPTAGTDTFTVSENGTVTIDVLDNDSDEDGDALTITQVNGSAVTDGGPSANVGNGSVQLVGGQLVFTPNANYVGPASFSYVVSDGNGLTSTAFVNGNVNGVAAQAPVAENDTVTVLEDGSVTIDVLDNDNDPDGGTLSIIRINGNTISNGGLITVDKGTVRLVGGQLIYEPYANENGAASFTYTIRDDDGLESIATVNVSITPVNDAPIGANIILTIPEDITAVFDPVRFPLVDSGGDVGDSLDAVIIETVPDDGSLLFNGVPVIAGQRIEASDLNLVSFTPGENETSASTPGTDYTSFTFRVVDDGGTANGGQDTDPTVSSFTVRVTAVNDAPDATDNAYNTPENTPVSGNAITDTSPFGADSDVDGDALTLAASSVGTFTTAAGGAITLNADGSFVYSPVTGFIGNDSFDYTVTDGTAEDTAKLHFSVAQLNVAPVAVDNDYVTAEDTSFSGNAITDASAAGADFDGNGDLLTLAPASIGTFATAQGGSITLSDDGSFTYDPLANFNGTDSFDYTITDGLLTDTATLTFDVTAVNDTPVATQNTYSLAEDGSVSGNAITDAAGSGVDSDADGDTLTLTNSTIGTHTTEEGGTITLSADGSFTYVPPANFSGTDKFEYRVTDGGRVDGAFLIFNVSPVNDDPITVDDTFTVVEGQSVTIDVLANDSDVEDAALEIVIVNGQPITDGGVPVPVTHGTVSLTSGQLIFTPASGFIGSTSFGYMVSDGSGGRSTGTVSGVVTEPNEAPVAQDNSYTSVEDDIFTGNALTDDTGNGAASDPDGTVPEIAPASVGTFTTVEGGSITMSANGDFTYQPAQDYFGTDSFDYTIWDGDLSDSATLIWEITPVNDAPVASDLELRPQLPQGNAPVTGNVLSDPSRPPNVSDVDGDTISVDASSIGTFTTVGGGTVTITSDGEFRYIQRPDFRGDDEFTVTFTDGSAQDTATIVIAGLVPVDNSALLPKTTVPVEPDEEEEDEEQEEEESDEDEEASEDLEDIATSSEPPVLANDDEETAPQPVPQAAPVAVQPEARVVAVLQEEQIVEIPQNITSSEPLIAERREPEPPSEAARIAPAITYDFQPIDRERFTNELQRTREDIQEYDQVLGSTAAKVTFGFGAVLGVGSVTWILQSGILAATLLSALPAWKRFDPIGVVSGRQDENDECVDSQSDIHVLMKKITDAGMRTKQ